MTLGCSMIKLTARSKNEISRVHYLFSSGQTLFELTDDQCEKILKILKKPIIGFSIQVSFNEIGPKVIVKYVKGNGIKKILDLTDLMSW